jgi:methylmalonyl-CoA mutase C-terminal domain/subunit
VVVGGIVPEAQRVELEQMGVTGVFTPGTSLADIVAYIRQGVPDERSYREAP